jgi:aspartyl protease family protein
MTRIAAALLLLACGAAFGQSVSFSGHMGYRALLVIDGVPRSLSVGDSVAGVRLVSVNASTAVVEVNGKQQTLELGGSPVSVSGVQREGGTQIVIPAGSGGHFVTAGSINGKAVEFMVDTGATTIALSVAEADRIGLKYKDNAKLTGNTANGTVIGYQAMLGVVRVGDVQVYNVEAAILPMAMPQVLLGNSFLNRFQMKRDNERMTLEKRP